MNSLTIHKLEIQAALLAIRLKSDNQRASITPLARKFMWINSTTVHQWLQSNVKLPVFSQTEWQKT